MGIGERIKERRIELNLSVDYIAEKLGKNRATIYRYESNEIENLPISILEPLSKILKTTPAYLMGWENNINQENEKKETIIDEEQKKIFAKNLNKYLSRHNLQQKEVADKIGVIPTTFNSWCTGQSMPRMGKVQALADFFGIKKSDLIEDKINSESSEFNNQIKELMNEKNGIYFRLAKEAKDLDLDEEDIETILKIYAKHRERNM